MRDEKSEGKGEGKGTGKGKGKGKGKGNDRRAFVCPTLATEASLGWGTRSCGD